MEKTQSSDGQWRYVRLAFKNACKGPFIIAFLTIIILIGNFISVFEDIWQLNMLHVLQLTTRIHILNKIMDSFSNHANSTPSDHGQITENLKPLIHHLLCNYGINIITTQFKHM